MFWRRNEMNTESFQVVVRVRKSSDFRLTSVARTCIELANVQCPLQQGMNLPPYLFRRRNTSSNLCATVDIPEPHRPLFRHAGPAKVFRGHHGSFTPFQALPAPNAVTVS